MKTPLWDMGIWIGGFLAHLGLSSTLLAKARWRKFPLFSVFIAFQILRTMSLFAVRSLGSKSSYLGTYWSLAIVDYLLQLSLIVEIGDVVSKPFPGAVAKAKAQFVIWSGLGVILAAAISLTLPTPPFDVNGIWDTRVSLFTSLLTCQCYVVLSKSIDRRRIQSKAHVLAIGNGLVLWSLVELVRDGIYAATRWRHPFRLLDRLEMIVYVCVTIYWAVALWRDEPMKQPVSARIIESAYVRLAQQPPEMSSDNAGKQAM